ncbi:MAG: PTS transporter subunit EIIC [Lachnospiraceae bacterium]|nr:PTS transporter subunit EIIC [Lachnospiraceae bacterium]
MESKNYEQIAVSILDQVGGFQNVEYFEHNSTRLCFQLVDNEKADVDGVMQIEGVQGVVVNVQFQVIIGQDITRIYDELIELSHNRKDLLPEDSTKSGRQKVKAIRDKAGAGFLDFMIGVFNPLVPAITGAGLLKTIVTLLVTAGALTEESGVYSMLYYAADAVFYFLPIMVAVTTATKLRCDRIIATVIVGLSIMPSFTELLAAEEGLTFLGLKVPNYTYSSQIFPAILTVIFLSIVEKNFSKICPKAVKAIFVPIVCFLIVTPVSLIVLSPLGFEIGEVFTNALLSIHGNSARIIVAVLGAIMPFLIAVGMHKLLVPYTTAAFISHGHECIVAPAKVAHNISEAGACFAVALRTKDAEYRSTAFSAGISAFFGISEPALYGVTMTNKKAMGGVVASGLISAAFMGILGLEATTLMGSGILGIVQFIDTDNPSNFMVAIMGYVLALVLSFLFTFILYRDEKKLDME